VSNTLFHEGDLFRGALGPSAREEQEAFQWSRAGSYWWVTIPHLLKWGTKGPGDDSDLEEADIDEQYITTLVRNAGSD
jgi:hypothetical protein